MIPWFVPVASATTLAVPGQYPTLADAIAVAVAGDIVEVGAGTWVGPVAVGVDLTIRGAGRDLTILRGTGANVVSVAGADLILSDLTVDGEGARRGVSASTADRLHLAGVAVRDGSATDGGGVEAIDVVEVVITGSSFDGNAATAGQGGALLTYRWLAPSGDVLIANSTFRDNSATGGGGGYGAQNGAGGAAYVGDARSVTVFGSTFEHNVGGAAGALFLDVPRQLVEVRRSRFCENTGTRGAGGILVAFPEATVRVYNSIFAANHGGTFDTGAVTVTEQGYYSYGATTHLALFENLFVANDSQWGNPAVDLDFRTHTWLVDNVFVEQGGPQHAVSLDVPQLDYVDYNLWWSNTGGDLTGATHGPHDLFADPGLTGFSDDGDCGNDDFTLGPVVIDAGHPARPRDPDGSRADLGPNIH